MKRRVLKKRTSIARRQIRRRIVKLHGSHDRWSKLGFLANRPWLLVSLLGSAVSAVVPCLLEYMRCNKA